MNVGDLLNRECGCKGCRTCLFCEEKYDLPPKQFGYSKENSYVFCPECNQAWNGWNWDLIEAHPTHVGQPIEYPGIYILPNFLSDAEESYLIENIDRHPWDISQSGRRKQNYGPKCNFKKRKIQMGDFAGFPKYSEFVQDKFKTVPIMNGFQVIEQCTLEYDPKMGASIDPHIDDCWIWGERIVTVNLLADTVLTMKLYDGDCKRYNLDMVESYVAENPLVKDDGIYSRVHDKESVVVRIPMPRKSLLVIYGQARYDWEHSVLREDVTSRRLCIAYREFTPPYLPGGVKEHLGEPIIRKAQEFWDQ